MRVGAGALVVALGLGVLGNWWQSPSESLGKVDRGSSLTERGGGGTEVPAASASITASRSYAEDYPLVEGLLDPAGSVERDLEIVALLFEGWQSNFPGEGNPVGENVEITAALLGQNRFKLDLLPADHPAINAAGELCDRWGTPLFFHQLSGSEMEVRSAGLDREYHTDDDVISSP